MSNIISVDKHTNLLIIGKAATSYGSKEINYEEDYNEVMALYGDSDVTTAFKQAKDFGVEYIFILNIQKDQDYFDVLELIKQNDFTYAVFVSLLLSDTFTDTYDNGKIHNFFSYIMGYIGQHHETVFLVTDKHASLYENIDDFLADMKEKHDIFTNACLPKANLENIIFVANNLENYEMANVPLACSLCVTDINKYPTSDLFGKAIFDIDKTDLPESIAYFKSNVIRETTIENLLNSLKEISALKIVFISRIMKYIKREIDFTEFKGKLYTEYQKLQYSKKLTEFFNKMVGYIINEFNIDSVEAYKEEIGTIVLLARIQVVPVNCLEVCSLQTEVEFA